MEIKPENKVEAEIKALRKAAGDKILKVIIETCYECTCLGTSSAVDILIRQGRKGEY